MKLGSKTKWNLDKQKWQEYSEKENNEADDIAEKMANLDLGI